MKNKKKLTLSRVPEFKNRQEMAEFWDTHSTTDYKDEWKPVRVRFAQNLSDGITIRFEAATLNALRKQAKNRGLGPTTLIRMWVLERLKQEAGSSST